MYALRRIFATTLAALVCFGCEESPTTPRGPLLFGVVHGLVVSEPISPVGGGADEAYVSVVPGGVSGAVSVEIRNLTAGTAALPAVQIIDGGFDPVAVPASANDRLELVFQLTSGAPGPYPATVPDRAAPTIVRTSVAANATNVPVDTRFTIVFSEPIQPLSLPGRLWFSGSSAWDQVSLVPGKPWMVEVVPATSLEPEAVYELVASPGIEDASGQGTLLAKATTSFTTETAPSFDVTEPGRIAFVSSRQEGPPSRSGRLSPYIYVAYPDGSGLTRLTPGEAPAWSSDGLSIAFHSWWEGGQIRIIDVDGANERTLAGDGAANPTWSPDGQRIAFERRGEIFVVNADGSGEQLLISWQSPAYKPTWSPDGRRIAMLERGLTPWDEIDGYTNPPVYQPWQVLIADADGTGISRLDLGLGNGREHDDPAWSPDGSRLAVSVDGAIVSAAPDGSDIRVHAYHGAGPDWSSDGTKLLYSRNRRGAPLVWDGWDTWPYPRIFVTDLATGRRRQIVPDAAGSQAYSDYQATWFRPGS